MNKTLEEKILEDLLKTGFIKELEVAQILTKAKWKTSLNQTYQDKDTNINREIDIIASKKGNIDFNKLHLWVDLVIECKQTSNPWVIISNHFESSLDFHLNPGWTIIHGGEKYIKNGGIFPPRHIDQYFMRSKTSRIGSAFHDSFKKSTETSKIFQAIMSACKAAVYKSQIHGASPNWDDYKKEEPTDLTFYHPIVIVDGPLFEAFLNKKNKIELKRVEWIPITYVYSSPNYSKHLDTTFHCDIVTFEYFEKYLLTVDSWLTKMNDSFIEYYKKNYD